jgi:hypothetical protein
MAERPITVYSARGIRTMDADNPTAEAVAVSGGRIVAVGSLDELSRLDGASVDDRFADSWLLPGFVEAHTHPDSGSLWEAPYVGFFDRRDPEGVLHAGCRSVSEVVERLHAVAGMLPEGMPILAWGFDPLQVTDGEPLDRHALDRVAMDRGVFVFHASQHVATVNSAIIAFDRIAAHSDVAGVELDAPGEPTGELRELAAIMLTTVAREVTASGFSGEGLMRFAREAARAGCTTVTDLDSPVLMSAEGIAAYSGIVEADEFPVRIAAFGHVVPTSDPAALAEVGAIVDELRAASGDKLRLGFAKLFLDGSIQGYTARLLDPGYVNGEPNGMWLTPEDDYRATFAAYHAAGATLHVHGNGDEAAERFLDVLADVLDVHPNADHRHTLTHAQLVPQTAWPRFAELGASASLFVNHIRYWGDQHVRFTLGEQRAAHLDAAASALAAGVTISLHSDSPVTPIGPLDAIANAVTRQTASGAVLGPDERISVEQAVHAMTLGAAYQLRMDDVIGSITPGKFADLVALDADPFALDDASGIRDIAVIGTVLGGVPTT